MTAFAQIETPGVSKLDGSVPDRACHPKDGTAAPKINQGRTIPEGEQVLGPASTTACSFC